MHGCLGAWDAREFAVSRGIRVFLVRTIVALLSLDGLVHYLEGLELTGAVVRVLRCPGVSTLSAIQTLVHGVLTRAPTKVEPGTAHDGLPLGSQMVILLLL